MGLPGGGVRRREDQVKNGMESPEIPCEEPELSQAPAWKHRGVQGAPGCPFHHLFLQCTADPFVLGVQRYTQTWFLILLLTFSLSQSPWFLDHHPLPSVLTHFSWTIQSLSSVTLPCPGCYRLCLCYHWGTLGPGICLDGRSFGRDLAKRGHISVSQPSQPGCSARTLPQPNERRSRGNSTLPSLQTSPLQLQTPLLLRAQAASYPCRRLDTGPGVAHAPAAMHSRPSHQEPSLKKAKIGSICISLFIHKHCKPRLLVPLPCLRQPTPESPQDGINPFCTGAE